MGIRCTLFGHAFQETEVERERDERGDEAVVTIREIDVCERCGERQVVSENKEVTSVAEPSSPAPRSEPDPTPADGGIGDGIDESMATDPETDDAVILDEGADEGDEPTGRQYGEWPEADEGRDEAPDADAEPTPWPDADGEDRGVDASAPTGERPDVDAPGLGGSDPDDAPTDGAADRATGADASPASPTESDSTSEAADEASEDDGAELLDAGGDADDGPASGSGLGAASGTEASGGDVGAPAEPGQSADDTSARETDDGGLRRAGEAPSPTRPKTGGSVLHCPSCGYRDDRTDGSLREGDICPECKRGYLAARD